MFTTFDIHQVYERLWLGPVPNTPERIAHLRKTGISALVSVQTDHDLDHQSLNWALLWNFLMHNGIDGTRIPITDFDDRALERGLPAAVEAVQDAWRAGKTVYLHCTAGVNRSPTVAIAWLTRHQGLGLDEAWDLVRSRRPCDPNHTALVRYTKV